MVPQAGPRTGPAPKGRAARGRALWPTLLATFLLALAAPAGAASLAAGFGPPIADGATLLPSESNAAADTLVRFAGGVDWPALRFRAASPLDWSGAQALALPVENPGDTPFTLLLRLDDDPAADGGDRSLTGLVTLPPHAGGRVVLPLAAGPGGMRGRPTGELAGEAGDIPVTELLGTVDPRHIVALHVSGVRSAQDHLLRLGALVLRRGGAGAGGASPLADRFGQAVGGAWPEKVAGEDDLRRKQAAAAADTARLARLARPARRLPAGGFRLARTGGRWRLLAPDGRPFFSLGVDAVTPVNPTIVEGREALFAALPPPASPLAAFYGRSEAGRRTFDVGAANLALSLGPDWRRRWATETVARLEAWGFNTLGAWSDPRLAGQGLATVTFYDFEGASAAVPMAGGRALPDPFDPRFAAVADAVAATMTAQHRGEPLLLGYFSGNEMPWGAAPEGIAAGVLRLSADSPAKRALVAALQARHGSPAAFAGAWRLPLLPSSWDEVLARPLAFPADPAPAALADAVAFGGAFAERYFATVAQAIRRHDPDHLYLGTRFADAPPAVVAACARWCDVMSFNVYGAGPAAAAARWRGFDRPVLIGEFHFGSRDRGAFWPGMVDAGSETRRGPAYAAYLDAALDDPAIVGVHWYQYADEPLTGRPYDGENGHIGLVAVTGIPFGGFVEAVAAANRHALARFEAMTGPVTTSP